VGYENRSQFSGEYRRMFGTPPGQGKLSSERKFSQ
jgi:AraC-like DNA-binding protein